MKVFISSLIMRMEALRAAAREAVEQLGHDPVMAEDFGAQPSSPQVTCLPAPTTCPDQWVTSSLRIDILTRSH
jgi:hypothetical protein